MPLNSIESDIQTLFIERGWTLSLAESCTGGALAARLTAVPGCSQYFLGSFVCYSNRLKINILDVNPLDLEQQGAVSGPVVLQMAQGIKDLSRSHCSLAVSGIAGPSGGTPEKPVGTIWGAIVLLDKPPVVWTFHVQGERGEIIRQATDILLNQLWQCIQEIG